LTRGVWGDFKLRMNRDDLDSLDKEALIQLVVAQAGAIAALQQVEKLTARLSGLEAENVSLRAENAALREKLKLPPKTPDNSSKPPSQGQKPSGEPAAREKDRRKAHAGAHPPLHPNPTHKRDVLAERCPHCRTDVSGAAQTPVHAYDRIEIPEIKPDVTRVTLHFDHIAEPCSRVADGDPTFRFQPRFRGWKRQHRGPS
jgi:transposase